jgi:Na+-transporting methylmalonyl-CoA/oxaloacetate decarboxylase beta subunit
MFVIAGALVYLAIVKKFEPLLLLPIAIGMLLTNLPGVGIFNLDFFIPPQEAVSALKAAFEDGILSAAEYQQLLDLKG